MMKLSTLGLFCAVFFVFGTTDAHAQNIVEIAQDTDDFSALVESVVAADLVDTLASEGPFTVFAPTNDAFVALPGYIVRTLESNPDLLGDILLYHVAAENLPSSEVVSRSTIATAGGENLTVSARDGGFYVDDAQITALDIEADNGTIHIIDTVLIPNSVYAVVLSQLKQELDMMQTLLELR